MKNNCQEGINFIIVIEKRLCNFCISDCADFYLKHYEISIAKTCNKFFCMLYLFGRFMIIMRGVAI